jgi:RNA polymerase sigma-70 factor (ECF subfamily)
MQNATRNALNHGVSPIPSLQLVEVAEEPNDDATSWRMDPNVVTMERLRDGDMEAFQVLFSKYSGAIAKYAYNLLGSRDRAEEVAQTVFLQLFRARKRYQPKARFVTFLYRITTNLCLNELRRFDYSGKIESLDVTDDADSNGDGSSFADRLVDSDSPGPAQRLAYRKAATEIIVVLKRLPSNQRMALLRSREDGFSYQEVADSSVGAVKSLICRATATLRKDLADIL